MKCVRAHIFRDKKTCFYCCFWGSWLCGLTLGVFLSLHSFSDIRDIAYGIIGNRASLFALLTCNIMPVLICAIAFFFDKPAIVLPVLFSESMLFSYCSQSIVLCFGDAGWLVRIMLTVSGSLSVLILLLYCCLNLDRTRDQLVSNTALTAVIVAVFVCFDFYAAQPFCAALLKFF